MLISNNRTISYSCSTCIFKTTKKSKWERHISTKKHKSTNTSICVTTMTPHIVTELDKNTNISNNYMCLCGNNYSTSSNYSRHKKTCKTSIELSAKPEELDTSDDDGYLSSKKEAYVTDAITEMQKSHNELTSLMKEQQETIAALIPKLSGITNNTTNNNTTNKFNINVFLNDSCKDALNLRDFVRSIQLEVTDLEDTARLGYVDVMTNIIMRGLNEIDITRRPIHCCDARRDILYVKEGDEWGRDNTSNHKMKRAIELINRANIKQLPKWVKDNPEHMDIDDPLHAVWMGMLAETMDEDDAQAKKNARVVKNIAKSVMITDGKIVGDAK
jgi:hypothetical protein